MIIYWAFSSRLPRVLWQSVWLVSYPTCVAGNLNWIWARNKFEGNVILPYSIIFRLLTTYHIISYTYCANSFLDLGPFPINRHLGPMRKPSNLNWYHPVWSNLVELLPFLTTVTMCPAPRWCPHPLTLVDKQKRPNPDSNREIPAYYTTHDPVPPPNAR